MTAVCPNHGLIPLIPPEGQYITLFVWGTYLVTAFVIYLALTERSKPGPEGELRLINHDVLLLFALVLVFWGLESLGHVAEPFLVYPEIGIMLPLPESLPPWLHRGIPPFGAIADCIACAKTNPAYQNGIPLVVVLMEALLAYGALKTTQSLGFGIVQRPFVSAIALVVFDLFADPVLAVTFACEANTVRSGVGLWFWYVLFENDNFANWYGIPLYNYAAWFCGPLIAIAFAYWFNVRVSWLYGKYVRQQHIAQKPGDRFSGLVLICILIFASIWIKLFNPLEGLHVGFQYQIFFGFYTIAILGVIASTDSLTFRAKPAWAVLSIFGFYICYVIYAIFTGDFHHALSIWMVVTCCAVLIAFVLSPYAGHFMNLISRRKEAGD